MTRPESITYRPGISQEMLDVIAAYQAGAFVGNADTATALATGATGAIARANARGRIMPAPNVFAAQMGYTAAALFLCNDGAHASGMRDAIAGLDLAAVNGVSLYGRWVKGFQGHYVPADGYGWAANVLAPGNASYAVVGAFSLPAHVAASTGLWGYKDGGAGSASRGVLAYVDTATDKVTININDGTLSQAVVLNVAITFGDLYVLAFHVNKTTNTLYARLVNVTTGVVTTASGDITGYTTLTGAGATPLFQAGLINGIVNGTGVYHLGLGVITAGISAIDVVTNLTTRLVGA